LKKKKSILFNITNDCDFRANNARSKAHSAEIYAKQARGDSIEARISAKAAAPDFHQPGN